MKKFNEKIKDKKFGKIIDVATRNGGFIKKITENLGAYDEIVGIDICDKGFEKARKEFEGNDKIRFEIMDAYHTDFPDSYFDLVCISNSLHHMEDIAGLLKEMKRIKKDDGLIIISELSSDGQFGPSLTHSLIHNLDCIVDTYNGVYHHQTYSQKEIREFVLESDLKIIDDFDDVENNKVKNKAIEERVNKSFEKVNKFKSSEFYEELYNLAREIQENYNKHGANTAVQYFIFAK